MRLPFLLALSSAQTLHKKGEQVKSLLTKVYPFNNPHETYRYYDTPLGCGHDSPEEEAHTLSEVMNGERNVVSPYDIKYRDDLARTVLCRRHLTKDQVVEMRSMVQNSVMFDMRIGDMPVSRPVGFIFNDKTAPNGVRQYILSHFDFVLGYAEDGRVSSANVSSKVFGSWLHEITPSEDTDEGMTVEYSYEVHWVKIDEEPQEALDHQLQKEMRFHTHKNLDIHWLSIINAFVLMMLILSLLLLIIVRVVRSDLSKYLDISDEDLTTEEEQGWKLLHGDVFRAPQHRMWLCAGVGTGLHLAAAAALSIAGGMLGFHYTHNAMSFKASGILCYTLTSLLGGYWSAWLYHQFGGEKWAWNIFVTVQELTPRLSPSKGSRIAL
jgi:transmembrane 9 superfamily protein 1